MEHFGLFYCNYYDLEIVITIHVMLELIFKYWQKTLTVLLHYL